MKNLDSQEIPVIPEEKWYNLRTKRLITRKPEDYPDYVLNDTYRVAGTRDMLERFLEINSLSSTGSVPSISRRRSRSPGEVRVDTVDNRVCTSTDDVSRVPRDILEKLCPFNFAGLRTKAVVTRVIDGDTFEVVFHAPFSFLSEVKTRYVGRARKPVQEIYALPSSESQGFFMKFQLRSKGVDAAEHNTVEGVWAKMWYEHNLSSLNDVVYLEIGCQDKYGRLLGDMYADPEYTRNLTSILVGVKCPYTNNTVCVMYDGGTKSSDMKSLTKIAPAEQREWRDRIKF